MTPIDNSKSQAGQRVSRRSVVTMALIAAAGSRASAASPFQLVMVEEPGCVYCARWHAEVGPAYGKSAEGRFAPLTRVRIGSAEVTHLKGLRFTPTFVLVEGEREIGRITGYPGADFFWGLLAEMLAKTPFKTHAPAEDIKT